MSDVTVDEFSKYHPDADCYLAPCKSTIAITKDGEIFYRYTGNTDNYISRDDFKAITDVCIDYDTAMTVRNNSMRKDK
ncbi:MAG: hypothetical protein ACI4J7_04250 [Ruminiclostridium sp.]